MIIAILLSIYCLCKYVKALIAFLKLLNLYYFFVDHASLIDRNNDTFLEPQ